MSDNLLALLALQPTIMIGELIDRSKRGAVIWNQTSPRSFQTSFQWNNDWYDANIVSIQNGHVLDIVKNEQITISQNSFVNDQVRILYVVVSDILNGNVVAEIMQDLNSLDGEVGFMKLSESQPVEQVSVSLSPAFIYAVNMMQNRIEAICLDGTIRTILLWNKDISGLGLDRAVGKMFWSSGKSIYCSGLDGSDQAMILQNESMTGIRDLTLDAINKKIYYLIDQRNKQDEVLIYHVRRCDYNGQNDVKIQESVSRVPQAIEVDPKNGLIFWCDGGGLKDGYMLRCDYSGNNMKVLLFTSGYVRALAADGKNIYIGGADLFAAVDYNGENERIFTMNGLSLISDLLIKDQHLYISDVGMNFVGRTDLNGETVEFLSKDSVKRSSISFA